MTRIGKDRRGLAFGDYPHIQQRLRWRFCAANKMGEPKALVGQKVHSNSMELKENLNDLS